MSESEQKPAQLLTNTEYKRLARMNSKRLERDRAPHVPPDHIVTGECSIEALTDYLAKHPFTTIRAREAVKMYKWLCPFLNAEQSDTWDLSDIIGDKASDKGKDE